MAYQGAIRQATDPHIKAGQGNPEGRKGSQEQAKESEAPPNPTRTQSYTTITYMQGPSSDPNRPHDCCF